MDEEDLFKAEDALWVELEGEVEVGELGPGFGVGGVVADESCEVGDCEGGLGEVG